VVAAVLCAAGLARSGGVARAEEEVQTLVLVGATGDLARRKLFPELHELEASGSLPQGFRVVAAGLERLDRPRFLARLRRDVRAIAKIDTGGDAWKKLESRIVYQRTSSKNVRSAAQLARRVDQVDREASASGRIRGGARSTRGPPTGTERQRLVYLALPPSQVPAAVETFGATRLAKGKAGARTRFIVEKPFGRDLRSARALDRTIDRSVAAEEQGPSHGPLPRQGGRR
jgi:glucose-6-phosphate 1-dehydrogenase